MQHVSDLHRLAMESAEQADLARLRGDASAAQEFLAKAFGLEKEAALGVAANYDLEPTRSVLFRSAASLALECGQNREAERMISMALSGNPPEDVTEELRDLAERVNFERHLSLRGLRLEPHEFQMTIFGPAVGLGIALIKDFTERIQTLAAMAFRTLERHLKKAFREGGSPKKDISDQLEVYLSVPRRASFAVSIRLGGSQIPGIDLGGDVVAEMFECMDLLNNQRMPELKERIPDPAYFRNFVGLAKQIAPDGERITTVGFTCMQNATERKVVFRTRRVKIASPQPDEREETESDMVAIRGNLRFADATKKRHGIIELVSPENAIHKIQVPLGMMADIVRPLFEYNVEVTGKRKGDRILLEDIRQLPE